MPTFERSSEIAAPAESAFHWHARSGVFERLTPPWEPVELVEDEGTIEDGDRKVIKIKNGPVSMKWVAVHQNYDPPRSFQDVQKSGPFASWVHTHSIAPLGADRCKLTDHIEYELPLGWLGRVAGGSFTERKLDRMFRWRHAVSKAEIEHHYQHSKVSPMKVLITGSSGLVGTQLRSFLSTGGHAIKRLVRSEAKSDDEIHWDIKSGTLDASQLEGFDAIVHLAGENIAKGRWSDAKKKRIRDSRVQGTRLLAESLAKVEQKPKVFYCASAIGFYGDRGDEVLTEQSPAGEGFLAEVCQEWEAAADPARDAGIRTVHGRFGVVLSAEDAALKKMLPIFKLGGGGRLGDGKQYWAWVAIDDVIHSISHALHDESISGPVNVTASNPVTNLEFTKVLGKVLKRPTIFPAPKFAVRLALGEMADALLFASLRVVPEKLEQHGYEVLYPELEGALRHLLGR